MGKILLLFCLIPLFVSCAQTEEELTESAIKQAKYYLNSMKCSKAKSALDEVDFQEDNADYISTYASAYACEAGYQEMDVLFGSGGLTSIDPTNLIGSLATFSTSDETQADSDNYEAIHNAIMTLISYDDDSSGAPSATAREDKFGTKKAGDMSMQALYLILTQMGKHFALYGNKGNDGTKGGDLEGFGNTCLYSYTLTDAVNYIDDVGGVAGLLGSCTSATGSEGSAFLDGLSEALLKERFCKGIIYYNNLVDILSNTTLPASDSLGDISDIQSELDSLMTTASTAEASYNTGGDGDDAIAALDGVTSMDDCEAITVERLEKFYAIFFEFLYQ